LTRPDREPDEADGEPGPPLVPGRDRKREREKRNLFSARRPKTANRQFNRFAIAIYRRERRRSYRKAI